MLDPKAGPQSSSCLSHWRYLTQPIHSSLGFWAVILQGSPPAPLAAPSQSNRRLLESPRLHPWGYSLSLQVHSFKRREHVDLS